MGKLSLQIKADLQGIEELYTNHPDYTFLLKIKCTSCGEVSDKWHDVTESQTFPGKSHKSENNYIAKCKFCGRDNCLDIVPGTNDLHQMGKINLQIKATLQGIEELYTNHPDYTFLLKFKCTSCREVSKKWKNVCESQTFPDKTEKSEYNYIEECWCERENCLDILQGTNGKYTEDDQGNYKTIVIFECRGIEPVEFSPSEGWLAKVKDSGKIFDNIDLSEKEWVEYDEISKQSVGVYEFVSRFVY